jgi:transposase
MKPNKLLPVIKMSSGIDMSKDTFSASFGTRYSDLAQKISAAKIFPNNEKGFEAYHSWLKTIIGKETAPFTCLMEATGSYFENLAYFLSGKNIRVVVLLPNKTKHFAKSLDIKSKTDSIDARMITLLGLERELNPWKVPSETMRILKEVLREYESVVDDRTKLKNQLHAKKHSHLPNSESIQRIKDRIALLNKHQAAIMKQIRAIISTVLELKERIRKITTIKGIGILTVVRVIAETDGFALITNAKQLTSYVGLDIVFKESGTKKGKTTISKKGNSHIRKGLFMPAMGMCRRNGIFHDFYQRIASRTKKKMMGIIAVERKLLVLIYTLWEKNEEYIPNYNVVDAI